MSEPIRISQYAKLRGVSDEAVRQAVIKGRLSACVVMVKGKPWIGDVILANREWELNTSSKHKPRGLGQDLMSQATTSLGPDAPAVKVILPTTPKPRKVAAAVATAEGVHVAYEGEPEDPGAIDPTTGVPKVHVSRARKEYFDAVGAQAKAELLAGSQVNREEVTRAAFNVAREVRDALFLIKDRLADELATMTEPNKISAYLDTEFRNALSKLAEEIAIDRPDVG